jgi:hypothetical protein
MADQPPIDLYGCLRHVVSLSTLHTGGVYLLGKRDVDGVKRYNKVFGAVNLKWRKRESALAF